MNTQVRNVTPSCGRKNKLLSYMYQANSHKIIWWHHYLLEPHQKCTVCTLKPCAKRSKVGKHWSEALWHKFWIILTVFCLSSFTVLGCITGNETTLADIHSYRLFDFWVLNLNMRVCVFCTMDLFICVFCTMDAFVCSVLWICLCVI